MRFAPKIVEIRRPKRAALSKRTRFEIFKRDGFTCQYCNRKPPEVTLEIDHIIPVAKKGTDDPLNLLTSCEDCNRGKSDKTLYDIPVSPDAEMERLRLQQEIREAARCIESRNELDRLESIIISAVQRSWRQAFEQETKQPLTAIVLSERQAKVWLCNYSPQEITEALDVVGGYIAGGKKFFTQRQSLFAYISGVLRNTAPRMGHG